MAGWDHLCGYARGSGREPDSGGEYQAHCPPDRGAILNPLLKLDTTALTRALTEYKLELSAYSADLEEENEILMKDIIEEQSGAYIQDKAAALGIDCQVTVEADGEEEWPIPQSVTVMGSLTAEQQEALERTIEEDFAIPAERQRYESGDEG